ncbi:MAG: hypothetical protein KA712_06575 [Myxococcales bacterium]|nr:hypothetical protein [Myxococcales bacterium]
MTPESGTEWLDRLSAEDWLAAAQNELAHSRAALERRGYRPGITHARRAAGMALNAVLRLAFDASWGRSYMDHVVAIAKDDQLPQVVKVAAQTLVQTPPAPPELVPLGRPDLGTWEAAAEIVGWARNRVQTLRAARTS